VSRVLWSVLGLGAIAAFLIFGCAVGADESTSTLVLATPSADSADSADSVEGSDRISHPPVRQSFAAAPYELVVSATDDWRTPLAHIELYKDETLLWQKNLPHGYGPRFALVNTQGQAVLFDEYINVGSPYAIMLMDVSGTEVVQYSFDDIKQWLADVALSDITRQSFSGLWISAAPVLDAGGDRALVKTGGTTLELDMTTGQLIRRDDLQSLDL
jgi:hypothetical protein